jgi:isopenicillin N synthase-like dioxygenase
MPSPAPSSVPLIDVRPLFSPEPGGWARPDRELTAAARDPGFLCVAGLPDNVTALQERSRMLAIFALPESQKRRLYRRKFAPENRNIYRGWFPVQPGNVTSKEGIDIGRDVADAPGAGEAGRTTSGDPLLEGTPLPQEALLPGWRAAVAGYYRGMERVAQVLMRSLARGLGLPAAYFDDSFHGGLSTLRLLRYPPRDAEELRKITDPDVWIAAAGKRHYLAGAPHTDSGFVTLLAQDGVGGLQARATEGRWMDVPPVADTLVVNFGQVLEQWSAGRIRATEHRVLGNGIERHSIPFFYEARADATIAPLPMDPPGRFAPFLYGDFLWQRMTSFVEFRGMELERTVRARTPV